MMKDKPLDSDQRIDLLKNIDHFKQANIFQANIISFLTGYVTETDTRQLLEKSFIRFDKDGDGFISREEAREKYEEFKETCLGLGDNYEMDSDLFDTIDINRDGKISFDEFMTAAIDKIKLLNDNNLKIAFNMLDKDNSKAIEKSEITSKFIACNLHTATLMRDQGDYMDWSEIMDEMDKNNDGKIQYEEFKDYMQQFISKGILKRKERIAT